MTQPETPYEAASYDLNKFRERRMADRRFNPRATADRRTQPVTNRTDENENQHNAPAEPDTK
jgi:hypothetical protein